MIVKEEAKKKDQTFKATFQAKFGRLPNSSTYRSLNYYAFAMVYPGILLISNGFSCGMNFRTKLIKRLSEDVDLAALLSKIPRNYMYKVVRGGEPKTLDLKATFPAIGLKVMIEDFENIILNEDVDEASHGVSSDEDFY